MTKEEKWKAALEEVAPLLEEVRRIRDKYELIRISVSASRYSDMEPYSDVETGDDPDVPTPAGEIRYLSYGAFDAEEPHYLTIYAKDEKREDAKDE